MNKYIMFLRAINVGGKNLIKMDELKAILEKQNLKNVKTYIQSGNVYFESKDSEEKIYGELEPVLQKRLNKDVLIYIRTVEQINKMIAKNIFKDAETDNEAKQYVMFLNRTFSTKEHTPVFSPKKGVRIIHFDKTEIYALAFNQSETNESPNQFVEKRYDLRTTSRNWNTITKMMTSLKLIE